jgi:hypothetical protein
LDLFEAADPELLAQLRLDLAVVVSNLPPTTFSVGQGTMT